MTVYPPLPFNISVPPLPTAPPPVKALQASKSAAQGTPIGGVQVQISQIGAAFPTPRVELTFNQSNSFSLAPYQSPPIAGTFGATMINLAASALDAGWLNGHNLVDPMGALQIGTFILGIDPTGLLVTLSAPPLRILSGVPVTAFGTNLVTNWPAPITPGELVGEIQASGGEGYLTSYFQFLVTIT